MEENGPHIYEGDIARYFFNRLIELGYAVTNEEAFVLGKLMFDYLIEQSVIEEYDIYEMDELEGDEE